MMIMTSFLTQPFSFLFIFCLGERTKGTKNILQGEEMWQTHPTQSNTI